ncbi:MAG: Gfo/Idh/MocA family protein [Planctomycetota bacterium]
MRVALIGAGHLGSIHGKLLKGMADVELAAVVDPNGEAAARVAGRSGARLHADHGSLLAAGVHCLVEKPITETVDQARELVELAERKSLALAVGHVERYNPAMIALRPEIGEVKFVECRRVSPYPFRSTDVGVTMDVMIHDIDLILDLVGRPLVEVQACGARIFSPSEDVANARLAFEGGAVADVTASRVALKAERKLRIFQSDAYMSVDLLAKKGVVYRKSAALRRGEIDPASLTPAQAGGSPLDFVLKKLVEFKKLKIPKVNPIGRELEDFLSAAREGRQPPVSGAQGLAALQAAEMILDRMSVQ